MESSSSIRETTVPLESVLRTGELDKRPRRPPDYEAENGALNEVITALADSPATIFGKLVEVALKACRADSAGISLLEDDGKTFYWPAVAGAWSPSPDSKIPREGLPCGIVLDRNTPQLFVHPERHYPHLLGVKPPIKELLLFPLKTQGKAIGTLWVVTHNKRRHFDAEDRRIMTSLVRCTAAAYQAAAMMNAITEAEKSQREHNRRKDEFLAMLAHELRNPLTPIRNAAQILRLPGLDDESKQAALGMLDRQIEQMIRLVGDLLDASHITRGKISLRRQRTELSMVAKYAVDTTRPLCMSRDLHLQVSLPPRPIYLEADPTRLTQMISNLLNNAYKFTQLGGEIQLSIEREGPHAVIRVRDNGIGIAEDQLPRIFEMFTQADTSLERSQSGLGIGLSLVKSLAQMHGGTVEAVSPGPGRGSEFIVRLPVIEERADPAEPQRPGPSADRGR